MEYKNEPNACVDLIMKYKKTFISVVVALGMAGGIFSFVFDVDDRYVHAEDMKQYMKATAIQRTEQQQINVQQQQINQNILNKMEINTKQERLWSLEAHYAGKYIPIPVKQEMEQLRIEIHELSN